MPELLYLDDTGVAVLKTLIGEPTDEQVTTAVHNELVAHPEWTTTVQDGSITGVKIADDTIPDAKLAQTGGVLESVANLDSALDELTVWSDEYEFLTPLRSVSGKYVYNYNVDNKLRETSDTSFGYSVFAISQGKYKIHGFGYDRPQFYMAVIGDNSTVMEGTVAVSNFIQNIECGGSAYPADYTYHTVEVELEHDGFLFVNYKVEQSAGTCAKAKLATITDPTIVKRVDNVTASEGLHGVVKDGADYYHFTPMGDRYLIRKFKQMGANNLFQWAGIYLGNVTQDGVTITDTIISYDTDIVGPISIFNTELWPGLYGQWTGGNHSKTVDGANYPTARQESIKLLVNGAEVSADGVYYGDAKFLTENSLYFPQSVNSADLTAATKAITETREYCLGKQLKVRVQLRFVNTTMVGTYHGMQAVIIPYEDIYLANNEFFGSLPNSEARNFAAKEHEIILNAANGLRLIVALSDIGLGTYAQNDGNTGYVLLPSSSTMRKLYYNLIAGTNSHAFDNGDVVMWEGEYNIEKV